ncbi:MAG: hypothetical protein M1833_000607 [Piccolia ochrophora]|nr:MAG: hypothetical protein M1833_000607 [Piccolia ochrophora]
MASEQPPLAVNGTYAPPAGQHAAAAGNPPSSFGSQGATTASSASDTQSTAPSTTTTQADAPKDEVEWQFIKYYYTTLGRNPENLHLFYTKKSQFVSGVEAEIVPVSAGRTSIMERIKELNFQNCKVRLSNVDFQSSFNNIVIQVIGEMSNQGAPHRKFVQTFVLAEQPNGYFVLNDVFRYISEEEEEEVEAEDYPAEGAAPKGGQQEAPAVETKPKVLTSSDDPERRQHDAGEVDKQLEQKVMEKDPTSSQDDQQEEPTAVSASNGRAESDAAEVGQADAPPVASSSVVSEDKPVPDSAEAEVAATKEAVQPEKPKDPDPTPSATPAPATPTLSPPSAAQPAPKPSGPRTWANLVAASGSTAPVAPPSSTPSPAQSQTKPGAPPTEPSDAPAPQQPPTSNAGWQTAGPDHAKRQSRPQSMGGAPEKEGVSAYVKNVTDKVPADVLKSTLQKYGELAYFDISRPKNCAFVDFATTAGYHAAVAANPHQIGGEHIYVEERRPRVGAYGGGGYGPRGGLGGRGRGGPDGRPMNQGRGGYQKDGGRGGHGPGRGRGGNITPRGRGGNQQS